MSTATAPQKNFISKLAAQHDALYEQLFAIRAEFMVEMDWTAENVEQARSFSLMGEDFAEKDRTVRAASQTIDALKRDVAALRVSVAGERDRILALVEAKQARERVATCDAPGHDSFCADGCCWDACEACGRPAC